MTGNRWDDYYARRARAEGWLARSVFKLEEIDRKFKLIRRGHRILDLGCYPGSWSQYGLKKIGAGGDVAGIDLSSPDRLLFPNFRFIQGDVLAVDTQMLIRGVGPRDLVMSDLAPRTTGIRATDAMRSMELARKALDLALSLLAKSGNFVTKVFEGEDLKTFRTDTERYFRAVRLFRPKAVRKGSREVYLVGLGLLRSNLPAEEIPVSKEEG
jgi:23S rRNA (uridine2552-2'-O)-methyltransferase